MCQNVAKMYQNVPKINCPKTSQNVSKINCPKTSQKVSVPKRPKPSQNVPKRPKKYLSQNVPFSLPGTRKLALGRTFWDVRPPLLKTGFFGFFGQNWRPYWIFCSFSPKNRKKKKFSKVVKCFLEFHSGKVHTKFQHPSM